MWFNGGSTLWWKNKRMHPVLFYIVCTISFLIFAGLIIAMVRSSHNKTSFMDIIWTTLPFVMLALMLVPAAMKYWS